MFAPMLTYSSSVIVEVTHIVPKPGIDVCTPEQAIVPSGLSSDPSESCPVSCPVTLDRLKSSCVVLFNALFKTR